MPNTPAERARDTRVPRISRSLLGAFLWLVRRNIRRTFHAVRAEGVERLRTQSKGPLVVYLNHSSWWDPMVAFLLFKQLPGRSHFGPIDAAALARYSVLGRFGLFPVDLGTARGGLQFLRTAQAILASGGVLWITPQGRFVDPRDPLSFRPGLAALAARVPGCTFLPLAIEYTFWDERTPELLLSVGEPQRYDGVAPETLESRLTDALAEAMADLATRARSREEASFSTVLLRGRAGVGGVYQLYQQLRARILRQPHQLEHRVPPRQVQS